MPFLQLETPTFQKLGRAFIEGMSFFIPFSSYESRLFMARRLAGVPGYQYDVDMSKEFFHRQIFNPEEIQRLTDEFQNTPGHEYRRNMVFDEKMYLLEIKRIDDLMDPDSNGNTYDSIDANATTFGHYKTLDTKGEKWDNDVEALMKFLDLKHPSELLITEVDESNIEMYLNDRKYKELCRRDQILVKMAVDHVKLINNWFTKPLIEGTLSVMMAIMRSYQTV